MTKSEFEQLRTGDVVRPKWAAEGYIVVANYGKRVTAVRVVDMTNPDEWLLLRKDLPDNQPQQDKK